MNNTGSTLKRLLARSFSRQISVSRKADNGNHITPEDTEVLCPFFNKEKPKLEKETLSIQQPSSSDGLPLSTKPFDNIPGPRGLPIIGTLFDYMKKDGLHFNKLFEAYQKRSLEFGPIYKEKIANQSTVVVSDPEEYKKVVRTEGKFPVRAAMEPWHYYRKKKNLGQGLVNSNGPEWYKLRAASSKKMLKIKEVADFCEDMSDVAEDFTRYLLERRNEQNEIVGIEKEIFRWAMESIGTFLFDSRIGLFGSNPPKLSVEFIENLQGFFRLMQPLTYNLPVYKVFPTSEWKQFQTHADNVFRIGRSFVDKITAETPDNLEKGVKSSFVQYIRCQGSLSENEALATVVDLLVGATETTSNACLWTLYCLARNPEVQDKMYNEISKILPNSDDKITEDKLKRLQYVKAIFKESLRLYPITFSTSRFMENDIELAGYRIPQGTHVQCNLYGIYKDSKLFPDPEVFRPERWTRENNMDKELKSLSNLVWGHGARMCIGRRLAEQEIHILMIKIIQKFRLEYHHEPLGAIVKTVMTPDRPVLISFIPRD